MPTLRRILKYTPAVVLGLLVVAWVVSLAWIITGYGAIGSDRRIETTLFRGSVGLVLVDEPGWWDVAGGYAPSQIMQLDEFAGRWYFDAWDDGVSMFVPIPWILAILLPLAIGPFLSFRFRLWHYLAYTALVAVELAYYLRWQE